MAVTLLAVAVAAGCSSGPGARKAPRQTGPAQRTVMLSAFEIDPPDLSMGRDEVLTFVSTAAQPLRVEFVQPASGQAQRITCRPSTAAAGRGGEAAWETFRSNAQGRLVADMPPGEFKSICSLAPGSYVFDVTVIGEQRLPSELGTPRQGTITVK